MKPLNIVVATDNHYAILLAALIKSIEDTVKQGQKVNIYVMDDRIKSKTKTKLINSINTAITTLHFKTIDQIIPKGMSMPLDNSSYPLNIYLRIFIPYFIPADIVKILYMDVDMIVRKDLSALFEIDLGENIIAAVQDQYIQTLDNPRQGIKNYAALNLDGNSLYFNAGLLLIDCAKWRNNKITERTNECIKNNQPYVNYVDQYGLNVVLANQWYKLDSRWSHFSTIETENDPYIIHFILRKPIYKSYCYSKAYQIIFNHYLNQTVWKNFKQIGEFRRYLKKINNVWEKKKKILFSRN